MACGPNTVWAGLVLVVAQATGQGAIQPVWTQLEPREFSGDRGVENVPGLRAAQGFALDFDVRFNDLDREHQLFRQDGLLLLRMDPPAEGGRLSFFVNINARLEPRLRSVPVEAGTWYHVAASWDGEAMWLRVNDRTFRAERRGGPESVDKLLEIAAPQSGNAAGLRGTLRNVRVYDHPRTEVESLLPNQPTQAGTEPPPEAPRFEFEHGGEGWAGVRTAARVEAGCLKADVSAPGALLLADGLDYDVENTAVVSLRLSSAGGSWGKLYAATSTGRREVGLPLKADGRMHGYVLWMDQYPEWRGRLSALALLFDADAKDVAVDFVRCGAAPDVPAEFAFEALYAEPPLPRAHRDFVLHAAFRNLGGGAANACATLDLPARVAVVEGDRSRPLPEVGYDTVADVTWTLRADAALNEEFSVTLSGPGLDGIAGDGVVHVAPPMEAVSADYVPAPVPVKTKRLVGAHYCPLWKEGSRAGGWEQIEPFREREPLLGWYDENDPEVTDWEIKWARDHGIDFFVYCWYRGRQGDGPIDVRLGHAIHEGLFHARYGDQFRFCIMWENQSRGHAGVDSEADLLDNLLPFWIETYFKRPNYLVIDNKPLLFIYRPEFIIDDLGGKEQVRQACDKMRQACRDAGFDGLYLLGEDRGTNPAPLELMRDLGLDYSFSYCWPIPDDPDGPTAIAAQERFWKVRKDLGILPDLLTVSMGWDSTPWHHSFSKWRLTPGEFETACRKADAFMGALPADNLSSRIVLLDNWNEFGEGHYIAPHRQYGFGYLDAVRAAFSEAPAEHLDLMPGDLGLGPYDMLYAAKKAGDTETQRSVFREGGDAPGLVAWWTFDEFGEDPFAWDYTGHGHGGRLLAARRVEGRSGQALECAGGCVEVPASPAFAPHRGITISCWLWTDVPGQNDTWFLNRIHDGHLDAGYRFGLSSGRLTWAVPQGTWSHHLTTTEPLPLGRWVHVAGVCDNGALRIYMDGRPVAEMPRWGAVKDTGTRLTLGNYDAGHGAHFHGLLDDVRLYDHALTEPELLALAAGT